MKKIKYFLPLLFLILSISCSQENILAPNEENNKAIELSDLEYISIAFDDPKEISESEVIQTVYDFESALNFGNQTKSSTNKKSISVKNKYYIGDADNGLKKTKSSSTTNSIPIYELSLENNGIAYVSADERHPHMIAYIPEADMPEKGNYNEGVHNMIEISELTALQTIKYYEHIKDSLRDITLDKIEKQFGIKNASYSDIKDLIYNDENENQTKNSVSMPGYLTSITVGPLLSVQWDQTSPYNNKLPKDKYGNNYYVGCGAIAAAQVLSYIEPNMQVPTDNGNLNINWGYLKQTPQIMYNAALDKRNIAGYLMKDIYAGTKSLPDFDTYGQTVSSSSYLSDARNYLGSKCRWVSGQIDNLASLPVAFITLFGTADKTPGIIYARGTNQNSGGHAWVIDGIIRLKNIIPSGYLGPKRKPTIDFVHCNFGWGGTNNGYFCINVNTILNHTIVSMDFNTNSGNFNKRNSFFVIRK